MGFMDSVKTTLGGAVEGAAKDENIKNQVKSTVSSTVTKIAGDKVDQKVVKDTVNTVVDEAAKLAQNKLGSKNENNDNKETTDKK